VATNQRATHGCCWQSTVAPQRLLTDGLNHRSHGLGRIPVTEVQGQLAK
jgi:hypothetical protein